MVGSNPIRRAPHHNSHHKAAISVGQGRTRAATSRTELPKTAAIPNAFRIVANCCEQCPGGEGGIRTHGTLARTTVFETAPIDRSGTSPARAAARLIDVAQPDR